MKRFLCCILLCSIYLPGISQDFHRLSGRVIDADTREPVPFANVFLANTLMGTSSREDGTFLLEKIPSGRYDLTVSMVGYHLFSTPVSLLEGQVDVNVELKQETTQLHEVVIKPDRSDFDKYYVVFERIFFGETTNSKKCTIKNPDDLFIDFDTESKVLRAYASKPIEVENRALGYTVFYLLVEFEMDYNKKQYKVFGVPRFENIVPASKHEEKRWNHSRDEAYLGSVNHFMRSLVNRQLEQNNFRIYQTLSDKEIKVNEKFLFKDDTTASVRYKGDLKIVFEGKAVDPAYPFATQYLYLQASTLHFLEDSITIYSNGYFENFKSVMLDGYLAWSECMGNLVPLGFEPLNKK